MSLKKNILASYATQIYVTLVGILILPLYLKYMGAEAYGLVGFFTMLQAWFNLLDMGLTPTVARETARFYGGATDALSYRRLLRALQIIFLAVALLGGGAMFLFSGVIADRWLKVQTLPLAQVQLALQLMAVGVALRWMSGLYRGCISGAERLVWLGGFNAFVATLRFVGVLPILIWVGHSPAVFFTYQLLVAVVELAGLTTKSYRLFPAVPRGELLGWLPASLFAPIKPVLKFSLSIAFTSSVWVLVTQTDKLVLSKLLPLAEYGYFTLAVLAASGVMMISGPISSALLPRMARLQAEGDEAGLIALYRKATQMVAVIAIPACLVLAFFAKQVLWVWTGDAHAAAYAAPVLRLYALGNGFLAMAAFAYYLQFAKGDLKLHLIGSALFISFLLPSLVWATWRYSAIGAGYAWLVSNAIYFFFWVPVVHSRFSYGLHFRWLLHDVCAIGLPVLVTAKILEDIANLPVTRFHLLIEIIFLGSILIFIGGLSYKFSEKLITASRKYLISRGN
ncbi:lipopolysaccharide biosynthesis protein [Simplicispira hankyongi]|uniref:Polysaccharide biosynthesis protein n=1 Tax=Simplicispira hankyongi TaxID=2315688 RepID=A0A398CDR7_9BURK|nr:oligosaccharide flippase family protein [Simplicispira hankyongi]RID99991.1 polysaccharide biosynthesis protein [Simplicispira hankyongi]